MWKTVFNMSSQSTVCGFLDHQWPIGHSTDRSWWVLWSTQCVCVCVCVSEKHPSLPTGPKADIIYSRGTADCSTLPVSFFHTTSCHLRWTNLSDSICPTAQWIYVWHSLDEEWAGRRKKAPKPVLPSLPRQVLLHTHQDHDFAETESQLWLQSLPLETEEERSKPSQNECVLITVAGFLSHTPILAS